MGARVGARLLGEPHSWNSREESPSFRIPSSPPRTRATSGVWLSKKRAQKEKFSFNVIDPFCGREIRVQVLNEATRTQLHPGPRQDWCGNFGEIWYAQIFIWVVMHVSCQSSCYRSECCMMVNSLISVWKVHNLGQILHLALTLYWQEDKCTTLVTTDGSCSNMFLSSSWITFRSRGKHHCIISMHCLEVICTTYVRRSNGCDVWTVSQ